MDDQAKMLRALASGLDTVLNTDDLPKRNGFVLLVFEFDQLANGGVNYVSNAEREGVIVALKEVIARFEGRLQESGSVQ